MSYSNYGRSSRPFAGRSFGRRRSFPRPAGMNHQRYISEGVAPVAAEAVAIKHQFADFGFEAELLENITRHGYTTPTPIQDQAIPEIMAGKDVVGLANTGTGKTAAFLLPLINRILLDPQQGVLIVVPTRELAVQVADELEKFIRGLRLTTALCIGGANMQVQMHSLKRDPHFVIGTPGRLKDLLNRRAFNPALFTNIVLDEVDRMLDIGFVQDVRFLISYLPEDRKSYFFSATMTPAVRQVMMSFVSDPVQISVTTRQTSAHIDQNIVKVSAGENKVDKLVELLQKEEFGKVIVFGRTKHGINKLEEMLSKRGLRVSAIHGNKTQGARQRSLQLFKQNRVQALLATDIAARGIDVEGVTHVINYDEPGSYEDYIHRIGRTGRAGKMGTALTFVS